MVLQLLSQQYSSDPHSPWFLAGTVGPQVAVEDAVTVMVVEVVDVSVVVVVVVVVVVSTVVDVVPT